VHPLEFGIYAILGIAGGFLSVAFTKLLLAFRHRFLLMPRGTRWWHPVVGGVTVGVMGCFVPQVLGVGYSYVGQALHGSMALRLMLLLVVLKLFAITISYASGNAGGIFGPSLFLGAMLGGAVGTVAHTLLPGYTAAPGAYALVGMGALFAGIVRAPMTSVLMIFEMTRDYTVIVPLMIANLASLFISRRFQKEPIYEALAKQDGIHLPSSHVREELRGRSVAEVLRPAPDILSAQATVRDALQKVRTSLYISWLVEDDAHVVGVLTRIALQQAFNAGHGDDPLLSLIGSLSFPHVHSDHPLHLALERMSREHIDILPVVSRADIHVLEGVVTLHDVLESYGVDTIGSA
jgi:CIC family chloride channel protein